MAPSPAGRCARIRWLLVAALLLGCGGGDTEPPGEDPAHGCPDNVGACESWCADKAEEKYGVCAEADGPVCTCALCDDCAGPAFACEAHGRCEPPP